MEIICKHIKSMDVIEDLLLHENYENRFMILIPKKTYQ